MPNVYGMVVTFVIATPWRWASQSASAVCSGRLQDGVFSCTQRGVLLALKQYHLSADDRTLLWRSELG